MNAMRRREINPTKPSFSLKGTRTQLVVQQINISLVTSLMRLALYSAMIGKYSSLACLRSACQERSEQQEMEGDGTVLMHSESGYLMT